MPAQATTRGSIRILCALIVLAFSVAVVPTAGAVPYDVFAATQSSSALQPREATLKVLQSQEELQNLWRTLGRNVAPPAIDFRRHTVIAYFSGLRPTSGYGLTVESVDIRGGTLLVELIESAPGTCCVTTAGATSPDVMLTTIPWKGPVDVQVRRQAGPPCSGCAP